MMKQWHNCYDEGWQDVIVPEAFSHPAKMAYGLLKRILAHAKVQSWLKEGDVIVDPFGGIGSTGILGAYEGYQCVCCELERKFVDLAEQNFEIHKDAWVEFGNPFPIILQGDSRQLCQIVEKADCIVSSPPFMEAQTGGGIAAAMQGKSGYPISDNLKGSNQGYQNQGTTPGQLGSMKPGKVDAIISSPPYAESLQGSGGGRLKETDTFKISRSQPRDNGYGQASGNLGNLKSGDVDCVISSPPYEGSSIEQTHMTSNKRGDKSNPNYRPSWKKKIEDGYDKTKRPYGQSEGQLGQEQGDTFWSAAKIIIQQCHQILKPGGHAIWVVKSFVRKGKIVDFPGDWQRLCEDVGFKAVCVHQAMLVKETKHQTLFGDTEIKRKERKSFFRRLAESKGSPRIDFEIVLCMQKGL